MSTLRFASLLCLAPLMASAAVDFQRDVRPILSNNCFACHGPDKETRMAGLRLDLHEAALAVRKNGAVIAPGDPAKSLLYQRISAEKPALRMPPQYSHKTLTPQQIGTLKRWIQEGAPWKEQWSFLAPTRPAPPATRNTKWARNPIDQFILARLESAGLQPAPEAGRRKLIRRVTLDLTGLPPTPEEVAAFAADTAPDAYDKLVDRLLASPHYGEHRARYWLDAARYADTHGIHIDNYREIWPYRDWVINAFNRNQPFDKFTIEQLAGDLLPNPTLEQQIATGFHRCNVTTNEAGVIADEVDAIYAKDRVDTTGAVWLGLTIGCATCHDHKFDPLSQRDHYALSAFFRNTTQPTMDGNVSDTPPTILVPRPEDRQRWPALQKQQTEVRAAMAALLAQAPAGPAQPAAARPVDDQSEIFSHIEETVFSEKKTVDLPNQSVFDADKPFSIAAWVRMPQGEDSFTVASQADAKNKNAGWTIEIAGRVPVFRLTAEDGQNKEDGKSSIEARAGHMDQLKPGSLNHIVFTYDGSRERMGLAMFLNGKPVLIQGSEPLARLKGNIRTSAALRLGGDGRRYFPGGAISDFRIYNRALTEEEARLVSLWPELKKGDQQAVRLYELNHTDAGYRALKQQLASLAVEQREIRRRAAVTHVMHERDDRKPFAHLLYRGMYDQPREKLDPDVPAALPPMLASYPRNRLGLAQWLVSDANPLTARVTVNRFWQEIFGAGIVKTAEDFGSQGEAPSHPELLDWMAVEYRESGWDTKKFIKLMVTSATYRQAAVSSADKLKKDPENRLLSRGPRFRMDGEMVRDYALAASGLLTPTIGGPSVKPYQPDNVWETVAMNGSNTRFYKRDSGEKLYRRSMYTFWKRAAPPASMEIFNAPTREQCTVRRERTNTPLQALVTMNGTQFVEAARALAQRTLLAQTGLDQEMDQVAVSLLARPFDEQERSIAKREFKDYLNYYDSHPGDAKKLLAVGESPANPAVPKAEFAAMTMLVNQIMNLDEVLNK